MGYISGLVSVIIPTYHRCDLLKRAVESVLKQTYKKIECIVVNDNNPGDSFSEELYKIIQKFSCDERFIFLEQKKHINGAEARNYGIRSAKGEYIAFLDDDDWWKPEKIQRQVDCIKKQGDICGGVSTLVEFWDNDEVVRRSTPYKDGKVCKEILRREIDVTTCSILLKHSCLDETGYFDSSLKRHQEIQLLTFFTDKYELKLLKDYLTCVSLDDRINNPSSDALLIIKKDFFESVRPVMSKFSVQEQNRIKALHMFELAYICYKEKRFVKCIKYSIPAIINPKTAIVAMKRITSRIKETK